MLVIDVLKHRYVTTVIRHPISPPVPLFSFKSPPPFSQDSLSDIHLNARLAEEVDQAEEDMGSIISDDPDSGPIVRPEYWERFRSVMDKLNEADGDSRTAMMVSLLQRLTFRF